MVAVVLIYGTIIHCIYSAVVSPGNNHSDLYYKKLMEYTINYVGTYVNSNSAFMWAV